MTGSRPPVPYVPLPAAVVAGYPAHVIATVLRKHLPTEIRQYAEPRRAEALAALEALELAASAWRTAQRAVVTAERGNAPGAVERGDGNAATGQRAAAAPSDQITTEELARMLGVQERQARNIGAAHALGVQVGRTWAWSHAAVLAHLEERRSA